MGEIITKFLNFFIEINERKEITQHLYEVPKKGILTRCSNSHLTTYSNLRNNQKIYNTIEPAQTFTLKITLKETELIYLEDFTIPDSLALIGFTTAVITSYDFKGIIEANLEIQV